MLGKMAAAILALLIVCGGCTDKNYAGPPRNADEALLHLDQTMERAEEIDIAKRHRLDSLKKRLNHSHTPRERYRELARLFSEYRSYSMDTLLEISRQCEREALDLADDSLLYDAYIMEAESYKGVGEYASALAMLGKIPPEWREKFKRRILNRYCSIYYSLTEHSSTDEDLRFNSTKLNSYRDSIIAMTSPQSPDYWLNTASLLLNQGDYAASMASIDSLETVSASGIDIDPGVLAYTRGRSHEAIGDIEKAKYHYAIAAAYDLEHSVRKYEALQELARILSAEGDDQRAYRYIMRAINDIHASHATSRIQRISRYLPIISASYNDAQQKSTRNKNILLATSAILLAGLCIVTYEAIRKNKRLNIERRCLTQKNEELQKLRASLSDANTRLKESSKVKEESLGTLFNLCAEYIDSFDKFRLQMSQRFKAGKIKDINAALTAPIGTDLLQSFFHQFDTIFLDIFPDFIDKFNSLMKPGHELFPKQGELLSPELRIYALVRLGFSDSSKIATFLHYSPQTVYNYRFRVRSNALIPKEDFARAIKTL